MKSAVIFLLGVAVGAALAWQAGYEVGVMQR